MDSGSGSSLASNALSVATAGRPPRRDPDHVDMQAIYDNPPYVVDPSYSPVSLACPIREPAAVVAHTTMTPAHLTPSPAEVASSPGLARIYAAIQTLRVLETGKCPAWEGDDRRVPRLCVVADEMREDK